MTTITDNIEVKNYSVDSLICVEGETGNGFYTILTGKIIVTKKDKANKEHELSNLKPGDCFGEMSLIDDQPSICKR